MTILKLSKIKSVYLLIILALCIPHAWAERTYHIEKILMSWIDEPVSKVVNQWGYPDEETTIMDKKVYIWHHDKLTSAGWLSTTHKWFCDRKLFVNEQGTIIRAESVGNNCPFGSIGQYSKWANKEKYKTIDVDHTKVLHRSTFTL